MNFKQFFPILEWLPTYTKSYFSKDLMAGLTVSVLLVPQGMAYALLAGMPPIYGLYGALLPLFLFGVLGTSRQMSIGPVAISSLLILAGISRIAEPYSPTYISLVILTGLLAGIFQLLMSIVQLGFLANFLSRPIVAGFTSAAAVIIGLSQLSSVLGFSIPRDLSLLDKLQFAISNISQTNLLTLFFCIGSILIMSVLKKIHKSIPGSLICVILGCLLAYYLQLNEQGLRLVGFVPQGLPSFQLPDWSINNIKLVFPTVLTVTIMGIVESLSIAKVLESKHQYYKIRPNQELLAIGVGKIFGAFFQAIPTSASFSRSAVNNEAGARTGMASIVTSIFIAISLVFLTHLFFYLPNAILAAIILLSVKSLFDYKEAIHLWKTHKGDFSMMLFTFFSTLLLGIEEGVLIGVVLSILMVLYRISTPHIAVLGQIPDTRFYRNVSRFPDAEEVEGAVILRFDAQLFFGNAQYFKDAVEELVKERPDEIEVLILNALSITDIDSSGLYALEDIHHFLEAREIDFFITGARGPIRDIFHKAGFMEKIGKENQFMDMQQAVAYFKDKDAFKGRKFKNVLQTNVEE